MNLLVLLLLLPQEGEPPQAIYSEPPQVVYVEPVKSLPVWLGDQYRYPNWTPPSNENVWTHLLDPTDAHYQILMDAGYTERQLRNLSYKEATALHSHLHNYFDRGPGRFTIGNIIQQVTPTYSPGSS